MKTISPKNYQNSVKNLGQNMEQNSNYKFLKHPKVWLQVGVFAGIFVLLRIILSLILFEPVSQIWWTFFWMQNGFVFFNLVLIYILILIIKFTFENWKKADEYNEKFTILGRGFGLAMLICYFVF